eukprot:SAG11_NODE_31878_length_288_cov_0.931217_2_plen_69_part_01
MMLTLPLQTFISSRDNTNSKYGRAAKQCVSVCETNNCKSSRKIASAVKKNMVVSLALLITKIVCQSKIK